MVIMLKLCIGSLMLIAIDFNSMPTHALVEEILED